MLDGGNMSQLRRTTTYRRSAVQGSQSLSESDVLDSFDMAEDGGVGL
jgi:hypothetical protein